MYQKLSSRLFELDEYIRYVAVNQRGKIVEMEQHPKWPTYNPVETDRMEELIVNPTILELARRRGDIDVDGVRFVLVRYGPVYILSFPFKDGHISVGIELNANPIDVAHKVAKDMNLPV